MYKHNMYIVYNITIVLYSHTAQNLQQYRCKIYAILLQHAILL